MGDFTLALVIPNPALAVAALVILAAVFVVFIYNRLVRLSNLAREAWSGIDVQLKRRHNLVPNLVEIVKRYSRHEENLLTEVTRTRSQSVSATAVKEKQASENALSQALGRLFAVAEDYPDLKADSLYATLQHELVEIEDHLQMARRYYNGAVRDYNIRVESFPDNVAAVLSGFHALDFFEIETALARQAPKVEMSR